MAKKHDLPGWFPYAVTASFLVMLGAGIKSNWGRPAVVAKTEPPPGSPPLQQGGVLQEWFG